MVEDKAGKPLSMKIVQMDPFVRAFCPELGVAGMADTADEAIQNLYGAAEATSYGLAHSSISELSAKNRKRRPTALRVARMLERSAVKIEDLFSRSEA